MSWVKRSVSDAFDDVNTAALPAVVIFAVLFLGMSIFACCVLTEILFKKWEVGLFWGLGYAVFCLIIGGLTYYLGTKNSKGSLFAKLFFGLLAICGVLLGPFGLITVLSAWFVNWLDS